MIDNYVNTIESVVLYAYLNGQRVSADVTPTATAIDIDTEEVVSLGPVSAVPSGEGYDYYSVNLDAGEVLTTRTILITWDYFVSGVGLMRTDIVNVARPYFEADDLWEQFPEYGPGGENELSIDEVKLIERQVRIRVDAYCRQSFQDFGLDTIRFKGAGSNELQLDRRIYKLESVTSGELILFNRDINGDIDVNLVDWIEEFPETVTKSQQSYQVTRYEEDPVASGLYRTRSLFKNNRVYEVEARFGWKYLPLNVHQASILIANDMLCMEDVYRSKGVTVLRSSDYRIEFGGNHRSTTGNVDADTMLENYINAGGYVF